MASKITSLPSTRRRESSGDFAAGSLGSIGGSAVGSSVEGGQHVVKADIEATTASTAAAKKPAEALETASAGSASASASGLAVGIAAGSSPSARRPFRKRKGSVDFSLSLESDDPVLLPQKHDAESGKALPSSDALPSMDSLPPIDEAASPLSRGRGFSLGSIAPAITLDQLDALGDAAGMPAAKLRRKFKMRKGSLSQKSENSDNSSSHGTFNSQNRRFLEEAFNVGDDAESLVDSKNAEHAETEELRRERLGSFDFRDRIGSFDARDRTGSFEGARRERLESWGGMSDLSYQIPPESTGSDPLAGGGTATAAAIAATLCGNLANDLTATAGNGEEESVSGFLVSDDKIPSKISLQRSRLDSLTSAATDISDSQLHAEPEFPSELQKFVKAAVASVGDQLAEIAHATNEALNKDIEERSDLGSTASPMIGAASDMVDLEAVNAAVTAAEAAAAAINLASFSASATSSTSSVTKPKRKRMLPMAASRNVATKSGDGSFSGLIADVSNSASLAETPLSGTSNLDERNMDIIRERARAAAGYVPPSGNQSDRPPLPLKKRAKLGIQQAFSGKDSDAFSTPRAANTSAKSNVSSTPLSQALSTPGSLKTLASKGQSSQKWDSMFDCLVAFVEDRRNEETKVLSEDEKKDWIWDGNVPTTYKTEDGKALGRWVNNQRSAKSKGALKEEREERLINVGLKWSVLASNSWNEMLEELRLYVSVQTKAGRKWDGNVPTNYRIKSKTPCNGKKDDEDKNLGRWVNRQRSLYQAGKLRKDRQLALEKVGLKWSVLATTSWESMFETLCEYVALKTKDGSEWDGNVPANYRTNDNPPRALGRWINRQRSSFGKDRLKQEYIEKLNKIGLKWSVHERRLPISFPDGVVSSAGPFQSGHDSSDEKSTTATTAANDEIPAEDTENSNNHGES